MKGRILHGNFTRIVSYFSAERNIPELRWISSIARSDPTNSGDEPCLMKNETTNGMSSSIKAFVTVISSLSTKWFCHVIVFANKRL